MKASLSYLITTFISNYLTGERGFSSNKVASYSRCLLLLVRYICNQSPFMNDINVTPHVFRHTIALHLIEAGNDIMVVKDWLGHEDIKTTNLYVEISIERKRQALEKVLPPTDSRPLEEPKWKQADLLDFLIKMSHVNFHEVRISEL